MGLGSLGLALLVLVPLLLGAAALRCLGLTFRSDRVAYFGWAWMAGTLLLAALELFRLLAGAGAPGPVLAAAALLAGGLYLTGRRVPELRPDATSGSRLGDIVLGVVLVLVVTMTLERMLGANMAVIVRNDEAIFWSKRAKLFFVANGFGGLYAEALAGGLLQNANYPILNPLLELWVFDLAGGITQVANRLPLQLSSLALVVCAASALRRAAGPWLAAPLLLLIPSSTAAAYALRHAHSDALVALGALVGLDAFLRWHERRERAWLGLASLAAAYVLWAKHEGLLLFVCFVAALVAVQARDPGRRRALLCPQVEHLFLLPPLLVLAVTWTHNALLGATGTHPMGVDHLVRLVRQLDERLLPTLQAFGRLAFAPTVNLTPVAFVLLALGLPRLIRHRERLAVPLLAMLLLSVGMVAIYVGHRADLDWLVRTSGPRLLFQVFPFQLLWIAVILRELGDASFRASRAWSGAQQEEPGT